MQNVDFDKSLLMEPLFVADDFDCDKDARLVVNAADHLPKASFSKHINDFVPVGEMIARDNGIISPLIVIAKVGIVGLHVTDNLGRQRSI